MIIQEFLNHAASLLNLGAIYYTIQLLRCALVSLPVFAAVLFLRKTLFQNRVFLKSALWSLFVPVLFAGRMKFFYENEIGIVLFTWWNGIFMRHPGLCWLYIGGVCVSLFLLLRRRRKLKRLALRMKKSVLYGTAVSVADIPVTPFAAGVFKPVIVVPDVMVQHYSETEIRTVLLHEKTHIRLGHLLCYAFWDLMRALLWVNPLFAVAAKWLREDLEEACDWATIQKSSGEAYEYGKLLLKSMRMLQAQYHAGYLYAAFAGEACYQRIRRRMMRIARYQPYPKAAAAGTVFAVFLCAACTAVWVQHVSYDRCNEDPGILVYEYDPLSQASRTLAYDPGEETKTSRTAGTNLHRMISYDDSYVYVDAEAFHCFLQECNAQGEVFLVFGGFYKLPGFAGYGYSCCYDNPYNRQFVQIPYEKRLHWMLRLMKLL